AFEPDQTYHQAKRDQGHNHVSALRCLGKRWLKVLWRIWQNHTAYHESKHLKALQRRGSFVWQALQNQLPELAAALSITFMKKPFAKQRTSAEGRGEHASNCKFMSLRVFRVLRGLNGRI